MPWNCRQSHGSRGWLDRRPPCDSRRRGRGSITCLSSKSMIHPCRVQRDPVPPPAPGSTKSSQSQWRATERSGNCALRRSLALARRLGRARRISRGRTSAAGPAVGTSRCPLGRGRRGRSRGRELRGRDGARRDRAAGRAFPRRGRGGFEPDSLWGAARTSSAAASVRRVSSSTTDRANESTSGTTAGQALRPTNSESR